MTTDAPRVVATIESSVVVRAAERVLTLARLAAGSSRAAAVTARAATAWTRLAPPEQHFAGGVTLLAAVAVHVFLTVRHGVPAGWWWLILPGMAAASGLLLALASAQAGRKSPP